MKNKNWVSLTFCIMLLIILISSANTLFSQENLLQNPTFADNTGTWGNAAYWEKGGNAKNIGTIGSSFRVDNYYGNSYGPGAGYCAQILLNPGNPANLYPVVPGNVFTFSTNMSKGFDYKGEAMIKIEFYDYDRRVGKFGDPIANYKSTTRYYNGGGWGNQQVKGTIPEGTVSVAVVCLSQNMDMSSYINDGYVSFSNCSATITNNVFPLKVQQTTASSTENDNPDLAPDKAVDNNLWTRWSSAHSDDQWICLDFGETIEFNKIFLHWETACGKSYKIQTSDDNQYWTDIFSTANGKGNTEELKFNNKNARYVRMYGIERETGYGYSLYEFEVYSTGATANASSFEWEDLEASNAIDGDMYTRWSSDFSDSQWINIDLHKQTTINGIKLYWEYAYGKHYEIQTSDDDTNWTTIYTETNSDGGEDEMFFDNVTTRYVRMYGIERGTQFGFSLLELEVYYPDPTANASSYEGAGLEPANVIDGDMYTRWSSDFSDSQWIYIDFKNSTTFNYVKLIWEYAYGKHYNIQISDNANDWATIYTETNSDGGDDEILLLKEYNARYVRMNGVERGTEFGYSLFEFEVNCLDRTANASSFEWEDLDPANAIDGDMSTRWSSDFSDPQWISIDFQKPATFNYIQLHWEFAYGKQYEIQISDDDTNWTTVYTETNSDGGIDEILFDNVSARYVRMYGIEKGTQYGYSLYEFEVYCLSPSANASSVDLTKIGLYPYTYAAASNAIDNNMSTYWDSWNSDIQWICIDFTKPKAFNNIKLYWKSYKHAVKYEIQISNDAANWTTVYTETNGDGGTDDILIDKVTTRFIRMYATQRHNSNSSYQLLEFQADLNN